MKKQQAEMASLAAAAMQLRSEIDATQDAFAAEIGWVLDEISSRVQRQPSMDSAKRDVILACVAQWRTSLEDWREL